MRSSTNTLGGSQQGAAGGGGGGGGAPVPRGERVLKYNPTGSYDRVPVDMAGEDDNTPLVACSSCGRRFREDRIEKHSLACSKLNDGSSRRGNFNSSGKK